MPDVIMLLQLDHQNTAKVLDLIQQQATNAGRREPLNYPLLENIFDYLSGYPDQCHHPKEELVYRKLLDRSSAGASSIEGLVGEHRKLTSVTLDLGRAIAESRNDPRATCEGLADRLAAFVDLYRSHMLMEERHFFPLALQRLTRNDFEEIDFTIFDQPDRLFDREVEGTFAELRNAITQLGDADRASVVRREEAVLLADCRDIAAFNEAMRRLGEPVKLTRSSGEGYALEFEEEIVTHIPACSEPRAAWCAYFYWKAAMRPIP
jgi:hemerythrin-like domain-containing protein